MEQQIIMQYQSMRNEIRQMAGKIGELEVEYSEHERVIKTLKGLPSSRKAFRMVGGVLIERSVGEVLPAVESNRDGIAQVLNQLNATVKQKEEEANKLQIKHNIQLQPNSA